MIKDRIERVKLHVVEHKKIYIAAAGGMVVGAGLVIIFRKPQIIMPMINNTVAPRIEPVFNNVVNNGGHMRKIVRCLETNELWLSVTESAKAQGKNIALMSQHLNHPDVVPDINGMHFVIEALASN